MRRRFGTLRSLFLGSVSTIYEDGRDSVPKRRHIKFNMLGVTQKKEYSTLL